MLSKIDKIVVRSQKTHTIIEVSNDDDISWTRFYWLNMQSKVFVDIVSKTMTKMNKLLIESKSNNQQTINHLFELNKSYLSKDSLKDMSTYKAWLSEKKYLTDEPIWTLASLAWDLGNYRLAYNIAELEDMIDAEI